MNKERSTLLVLVEMFCLSIMLNPCSSNVTCSIMVTFLGFDLENIFIGLLSAACKEALESFLQTIETQIWKCLPILDTSIWPWIIWYRLSWTFYSVFVLHLSCVSRTVMQMLFGIAPNMKKGGSAWDVTFFWFKSLQFNFRLTWYLHNHGEGYWFFFPGSCVLMMSLLRELCKMFLFLPHGLCSSILSIIGIQGSLSCFCCLCIKDG